MGIDMDYREAKYPFIELIHKFKKYASYNDAYDDMSAFSRIVDSNRIEDYCLSSEPMWLYERAYFSDLYNIGCISNKEFRKALHKIEYETQMRKGNLT